MFNKQKACRHILPHCITKLDCVTLFLHFPALGVTVLNCLAVFSSLLRQAASFRRLVIARWFPEEDKVFVPFTLVSTVDFRPNRYHTVPSSVPKLPSLAGLIIRASLWLRCRRSSSSSNYCTHTGRVEIRSNKGGHCLRIADKLQSAIGLKKPLNISHIQIYCADIQANL